MWKIIIAAVSGVTVGLVGGVFLEKLLKSMKENRILKCSEMLEKNFGKPMFTSEFTFAEAKEWVVARQDKIKNGAKGIIMKINKDTFAKIGSTIEIDKGLKDYLLLGIYSNGSFEECLLVKYTLLDNELNEALKEGTMVIE